MIAEALCTDSRPQSPAEPEGIMIELESGAPQHHHHQQDGKPLQLNTIAGKQRVLECAQPPEESYRVMPRIKQHIVERPKLEKHRAINFPVGGIEVKVAPQQIKEVKTLWNILSRYVKRRLLIMEGYVYSLQPQDYGHFVVAVWPLRDLCEIHLWPKLNRAELVFQSQEGLRHRQFRTDAFQQLRVQLWRELLDSGRTILH